MSRIKLNMSSIDCLVAMADGNPGAVSVLVRIIRETDAVDPDSAVGWLGPVGHLDSLRIYGPSIWILWKDVCRQDMVRFLGVLRACQLGGLEGATSSALVAAASEDRDGEVSFDVDAALVAVQKRLPKFGVPATG